MKISYYSCLIVLAILSPRPLVYGQSEKQIVGYYPNWQWYDRGQFVDPEALFYEKYTVINYAFFRPMADGSIQSTDPWADENLLLGPTVWWPIQYHDSTRSLPYLAHQHGVKLLPSIGGWNDSYNFPQIAADPIKRSSFIDHCVSLINMYDFDGIDIDWEYPGYAPNGGTPQDKANFTLLMQELRDTLDILEYNTGREYLLTSCFGVSADKMENIEWENILPLVDMLNLMTYDFHGSWDPESNHHTPLYSPQIGDPEWCMDGAFTKLTQEYGVPPEKVNLGIAFYGKALANCTALYGPHTGYDLITFGEDEGQPLYYKIIEKLDMFTYHWDDQVKCPYLLGDTIDTFVTFDNPLSISYKAQYAVDKNALGVIIWEITGDYIETYPGSGEIAGTPLLDTVIQVFDQVKTFELKTFLEGPFNGTAMNTTLNSGDYLPLVQPYNQPPWSYPGTETVPFIPSSDVVDWILVELRDAPDAASATSATILARQAAFLMSDGSIRAPDGSSNQQFNNITIQQSLFAVIYHRNHLAIMSANPLTETSGVFSYDFTTSVDQAYNLGQKDLGGSYFGMFAADANADGAVDGSDISLWKNCAGMNGYFPVDFSLDGKVGNVDKNDFWYPNLGEVGQVPE